MAESTLAAARRFVPEDRRGGQIPFGPVVSVEAEAGADARLAAWLGRDSRPWSAAAPTAR